MSDNMYMCNSCRTFYPPAVACQVKDKQCSCGGALVSTNISVDHYKKLTASQPVSPSSSAPAADPAAPAPSAPRAPAVQYRKKPVPEMYTVPDRPCFSSRLFTWISVFSLTFWCFWQVFVEFNFWAIPVAIVGGCGAYLFASLCDAVFDILSHLGAIRWLMVHGDEVEAVIAPSSRTTPFNKQEGRQLSDKAFTVICIVLLALIVGGLILCNHLQ